MDSWLLGTIPWSVDELAEVLAFEDALESTPRDDWDLTNIQHGIDFGQHHTAWNDFAAGHQVIAHLLKKHNGQAKLVRAHMFRYLLCKEIFKKHGDLLISAKVIELTGRDVAISPGLFHAMASARFSESCLRGGIPSRRFSIAEILKISREVNDGYSDL
jgi:hypothetical protein